jgi:hypothetical protein
MMTVAQLREALSQCAPDEIVALRTVEHGEVCLTSDLTSVELSPDGCVLLVGDVDKVAS